MAYSGTSCVVSFTFELRTLRAYRRMPVLVQKERRSDFSLLSTNQPCKLCEISANFSVRATAACGTRTTHTVLRNLPSCDDAWHAGNQRFRATVPAFHSGRALPERVPLPACDEVSHLATASVARHSLVRVD